MSALTGAKVFDMCMVKQYGESSEKNIGTHIGDELPAVMHS